MQSEKIQSISNFLHISLFVIAFYFFMKNNDILIEESSGNIFADLGCANAEEALLKSNLAQAIIEVIEQQKLS